MPQIVADRRQIGTRLEKGYGRAVTHAVWMEPLLPKIGNLFRGTVETLGENIAYPEPGQRFATVIQEDASFGPQVQILLLRKSAQHRGGLWPQRAVAFFPAFTEHPNLKGLSQLEVAGTQIGNLLHASSRIKHRGQESVVTSSLRCCPVDRFQNCLDLFMLQVVDGALWRAFKRDGEN